MKLRILHYPDAVLAKQCEPIELFDEELKQLAQDMAETMYGDNGIGLAAPQVGVSKRLIVLDITGAEYKADLRMLVNPKVTKRVGECDSEEGCLSVPNMRTLVKRSEEVVVEAQDLEGKPVRIEADGLLAICLQHEIDHLDGVLILDRISRLKKSLYDRKVRKWQNRTANEAE